MRKQYVVIFIVFTIFIVVLAYLFIPTKLTNISSEKIEKIEIFNGGNGKGATITEREEIQKIVMNFNEIKMKKTKVSFGYMGYSLRVRLYEKNDKLYKEFIVNAPDVVRGSLFFYETKNATIDYEYLQQRVK